MFDVVDAASMRTDADGMSRAKIRLAVAGLLAVAAAVPVALGPRPALALELPHAAARAAGNVTGKATGNATDVGNGNVIVQMFDWPWTDIASECTNVLGPDGYGAVQISPPQESVVLAADDYPWWQAYQPVAYDLNSRFGTQAQLAAMIQTCHAAGIKVYADVVLQHMTAEADGGVGDNGTTFPNMYDYPPLYGPSDFSPCETSITDWDDEYQVWNCQLDGLATLNTSLTYVQDTEAAYLNSLIALGVDGFRWDSAKEMNPEYIADIEALLTKPVFIYQDVEWGAGQPVTPDLYEGTGSLLEYRYGWDLYDAFTDGTLASLSDFGPDYNSDGMVPSDDAVAFVDDQDTERDGGALYYADGAQYILANVFMLAWDYGTPMVLSDYAFSSYNQGPPSAGGNAIAPVTCGEGSWECEEQWPQITGMVGWHNAAGSTPVANWWSDGDDAIAFSRGSDAWVAINDESSPVTETFSTGLPEGTYCDVISGAAVDGACTGTAVAVNAAGQATVTVPADDAVAIDVDSTATAAVTTVNVTVPVNTAASGEVVYLSGTLSALGEGASDWNPAGIAMTPLSATEWTATITATADTALSYKYDLGGTWSDVEETADCGSVANRTMTVGGGTENDTVANWAGPGACGDSTAVISVTVPSDTPSGDTVYLSGNYDVLGTGVPSSDDWIATDYPMIQTGPDTWTLTITGVPVADFQYKFTLGSWSSVEETSGCGEVANRSFSFSSADTSYPVSDTVAAWAGLGSCLADDQVRG
jgi:alpha-amylase